MMPASRRLRALIVDDEPLARRNLRLLLERDPEIDIVGEADGGAAAVRMLRTLAPDLVYLDVQMPEMDGFAVLEQIDPGHWPIVVFVTAYDRYALRAFEVHAVDYLLKPFDDRRFAKSLAQVKQQFEHRDLRRLGERLVTLLEHRGDAGVRPAAVEYKSRLLVKTAGKVFFLKVEDIDWIGADDYYVRLHVGRKAHLLRETMKDLEAQLDPARFARIHRSTIVNLERIRELQPHVNGDSLVILHDGTELKLSRNRRELIEKMLGPGRR